MRRLLSDLDFRHFGERQPSPKWQRLQGTETMIAGAGAGLVSSTLVCPLDVVKTKLQAQGSAGQAARRYKGLADTITRIWVEEGFRGLYRGLGPTIFGYLPTWAIYFTVYDGVKERLRYAELSDWVSHITAAMTAGATGTIVTNPLWVIKTRFMTQQVGRSEERYRHTFDAVRQIYRTEGWHGFYRGLLPSLFGVTHVAVQFPLYEHLKEVYRPLDGSDMPSQTILFCSSVSKMVASVITYPHEVLRTRLQIQKTSASPSSSTSTPAPPLHHHAAAAPDPPFAPSAHHHQTHSQLSSSTLSTSPARRTLFTSAAPARLHRSAALLAPPLHLQLAAHHSDRRIHTACSAPLRLLATPFSRPSPAPVSHVVPFPIPSSSRTSTTSAPNPSGSSYEGAIATFKTILREEGPRGFYRGLGVNLLRTVPSSAVTILTYEVIMRNLTFLTHQHPELEPSE